MIKVRLYTREEYLHASCIDCNGRQDHVFDYQSSFDFTLYNLNSHSDLPFRDAESLRVLKAVEDITFISDDAWYTVMWDNERTCLSAIPKDLRFALMAIEFSRQGRYTWFFPARGEVWSVLADMPFDILIGWCTDKIGIYHPALTGADYQIINYPYQGKTIDVTVKYDFSLFDDDFYTKLSDEEYHAIIHGLYLGKDGKYYTSMFEIDYALQYYWRNDIEGIIKYIDKKKRRFRLEEIRKEYSVFEFAKVLGKDEEAILHYDCVREFISLFFSNEEEQSDDIEDEYLYFRDKFKVISHISIAPGNAIMRKLPILMVDKNSDGSYWVHGDLTCKYPEFYQAIGQVIEDRNQDGERFVLIIDTDELLDSVKDIDHAIYGFRVMPDSIEVFDVEDAVLLFGQMLKEAVASGRCKVDNDFY